MQEEEEQHAGKCPLPSEQIPPPPCPATHRLSFVPGGALGARQAAIPLIPLLSWGSDQANEPRVALWGGRTGDGWGGAEGVQWWWAGGQRPPSTQGAPAGAAGGSGPTGVARPFMRGGGPLLQGRLWFAQAVL